MKKLLYMFLFLFIFLSPIQTFAGEWEVIETPSITIESIPIDEEHTQVFDTALLEYLNTPGVYETEKMFPDGDSFVQVLNGIKLVRIDSLPNNIERYVTYLTFNVIRYYAEIAQYKEEFILQPLYLDVDKETKELVRVIAFETIDLNNFLKKEI